MNMDIEKQTFWTDCLEIIKNKISNQAFETWFSEVELIDLNQSFKDLIEINIIFLYKRTPNLSIINSIRNFDCI